MGTSAGPGCHRRPVRGPGSFEVSLLTSRPALRAAFGRPPARRRRDGHREPASPSSHGRSIADQRRQRLALTPRPPEQGIRPRSPPAHPSSTLHEVTGDWTGRVRSLLEAPSPGVLTTYRKDGSAHTVPVWFGWTDPAFEVVIAKGDVKLRHLARDSRCVLVVFEAFDRSAAWRWASWSSATLRRRGRPSRDATSESVTARACPPNGDPGLGSCSGSSPTAHASGICPESCGRNRVRRAARTRLPSSGPLGPHRPSTQLGRLAGPSR